MGCLSEKTEAARRLCPEEHPLKYVRSGKALRECSVCKKGIRAEEFLTCEECSYNLCPACQRAATT